MPARGSPAGTPSDAAPVVPSADVNSMPPALSISRGSGSTSAGGAGGRESVSWHMPPPWHRRPAPARPNLAVGRRHGGERQADGEQVLADGDHRRGPARRNLAVGRRH